MTPPERIEAIIKTHGYGGIIVTKIDKEQYMVSCKYVLPGIIWDFIFENYNVIMGAENVLQFMEYSHIGVEIYHNEFM